MADGNDGLSLTPLERYKWRQLNSRQVGRYAEYFAKMEFAMFAFDVYGSEVDDKGIDFVIRKDFTHYYDIQVKSLRDYGYVFMEKTKFELRSNLYLTLVLLFVEGKLPDIYFIPSIRWQVPDAVFVSRDYPGLKSLPEYGLNISRKNMPLLERFRFDRVISTL